MTSYLWRGDVTNIELNALHAEAFATRVRASEEWDWCTLLAEHSLGWVTACEDALLVGFVNVLWDGYLHAWLQDTMVRTTMRGRGIGAQLVDTARASARDAGCEFLHVDFEPHLASFYIETCRFTSTSAGIIRL